MGFLDFLLSCILGIIILPIGIAYGFFKCFYQHHLKTALFSLDAKFLAMAKAFDKYGGVICEELFNDLLITKDTHYRFGNISQTVSMVIGYNIRENTLTKTGWKVNKGLDKIFGKDHCLNAIKDLP